MENNSVRLLSDSSLLLQQNEFTYIQSGISAHEKYRPEFEMILCENIEYKALI